MANSEAMAGVHSYMLYGEESVYNTAVAGTLHLSAQVQSVRSMVNNNMVPNYGMSGDSDGGRTVVEFTEGVLELGLATTMKVTRWNFLKYVLGSESGVGPYTYVHADNPTSITLRTNIDNPGGSATDQEITHSGCVPDSCTIRCAVGQPVTCDIDWKVALASLDTTLSSRVSLPSEGVYNFTGGNIELPAGSAVTNIIDSIEISLRNSVKMLPGIGSRLIQNALWGEVVIQLKVTLKYLDNALLTAALGATTPTATGGPTQYATIELNFVDGNRSAIWTITGVPLSQFAQVHELNDPISEDITLDGKSVSVVEDRTA